MGRWTALQQIGLAALRMRAAQVALSAAVHALVLGGLLLANPWKHRAPLPAPPLDVELVTLALEEEEAEPEEPDAQPPPLPPPPAPPPASSKPAAADPGGTVMIELPEAPGAEADGEITLPEAEGPAGPGISEGARKTLAAIACLRMTEQERFDADCADPPAGDVFERPPVIAMLSREEKRMLAVRQAQLSETADHDNFLDWYVSRDRPIPKTMPGGIDNTVFADLAD